MKNYKDFYVKEIELSLKKNNKFKGFKPTLGGTGLGKSSGLVEAIASMEDIKSIYITNRHNLISEVYNKITSKNVRAVYLKSNSDIIKDIHHDIGLKSLIFQLEDLNFFRKTDKDLNENTRKIIFDCLINDIEECFKAINSPDFNKNFKDKQQKDLDEYCDKIYKIIQNQLVVLSNRDKVFYKQLLENELIWKVFPYIEYQYNPECRVLLMTIHKSIQGFFDGKRTLKLVELKNNVIFLDEFDFLEPDILKILCDEYAIVNPYEFVRIFYRSFKHWSKVSFWSNSSHLEEVRDKFLKIIEYIDDTKKRLGVNILDIESFRLSDDYKSDKVSEVIFQANEVISAKPFYLTVKNNSWILHNKRPEREFVNPKSLFRILAISTRKILSVFNYIKNDNILVKESIEKIWNPKNDDKGGEYQKYILTNLMYGRALVDGDTFFKLDKDKTAYDMGYSFIKLLNNTAYNDTKSIKLSQIELLTTPEAIIAKLSDNNLVFALSATMDLPRTQNCFNINWIEKNTEYIALTDEDKAMIKRLRDEKANRRNTKLELSIIEELDNEISMSKALNILFKSTSVFGNDRGGHLQSRLLKTLSVIDKILDSDKFSHLMFLTTFKEIKTLLTAKDKLINDTLTSFEDVDFESSILDGTEKYFTLKWNSRTCNIIFLSAEDARLLEASEKIREQYNTMFKVEKVIVITQYKSASNGVNLLCCDKDGTETDFKGLHLVEEPHYWFDNEEEDISKFKQIEKQALWYLWKLWYGKQITDAKFNELLNKRGYENLKPDIDTYNKEYKYKVLEKVLSCIALYHQAIGRIERQWSEISEVEISIAEEIVRDFYRYTTNEDYADIIKKRDEHLTSDLILKVQKSVGDLVFDKSYENSFKIRKSIAKDNENSIVTINRFLKLIEEVKVGIYDTNIRLKIMEDWENIREFVLKHNFGAKMFMEYLSRGLEVGRNFCFQTSNITQNVEIFLENNFEIVTKKSLTENTYVWNLNKVYQPIVNNEYLLQYFEKQGYKTCFEREGLVGQRIFTPYIYQSILKGAVGEKAIQALIEKQGISFEILEDFPYQLFEVADAKVKDLPIYIDYKNYGTNTLDAFSDTDEESALNFFKNSKSTDFIEKQIEKYKLLKRYSEEKPVFYILNLYSETDRIPDYFNEKGKRISLEDSCIRIIPSVLEPKNQAETSSHFENLIKQITNYGKY